MIDVNTTYFSNRKLEYYFALRKTLVNNQLHNHQNLKRKIFRSNNKNISKRLYDFNNESNIAS